MLHARRKILFALAALCLAPRLRAAAIWKDAAPSGEPVLLEALRAARFRLLGEVHDNPAHHAIRARLLDALGRAGLKPAVAFEQFEAIHRPLLEKVLESGSATADQVAEAVRFDGKGWNWDFYRPIVETALRHRMPLRAAGLGRAEARRAAVDPWPAGREEILGELISEGHCRALPASALPGMVRAQRARDAKMAEALLRPSKDGAVLIAGNGHVRKDVGVPAYLPAAGALSVGFLEEGMDGNASAYDFAWITAPAERPDPCEAFRKK